EGGQSMWEGGVREWGVVRVGLLASDVRIGSRLALERDLAAFSRPVTFFGPLVPGHDAVLHDLSGANRHRSNFLMEPDLFVKPVSTFPDHALAWRGPFPNRPACRRRAARHRPAPRQCACRPRAPAAVRAFRVVQAATAAT